jgi:hypothetical protein
MIHPSDKLFNSTDLHSYLLHLEDTECDDYESDAPLSPQKNIQSDILLREFVREGDKFKAVDNYYRTEEKDSFVDINHSAFVGSSRELPESNMLSSKKDNLSSIKLQYSTENNCYFISYPIFDDNNYLQYECKEYIDLYIIHDLILDIHDVQITKQQLLFKMSMKDIEMDEKLIKDLYLDTYYTIKDKEIQEEKKMKKKYIFAIRQPQLSAPQNSTYE